MNCYSSDRSVTRSYYRGAAGALLVYDIAKYVKPLFIYCCYSVELKIFVYQWLQNWQESLMGHFCFQLGYNV